MSRDPSHDGTIHGFTHSEVSPGTDFSYLLNYTNGTAFYISTVIEDVFNGSCNSSITFVPIPNNKGLYPTSFMPNPFMITCSSGNIIAPWWEYRVAGMLTQCAHLYTMPCCYMYELFKFRVIYVLAVSFFRL